LLNNVLLNMLLQMLHTHSSSDIIINTTMSYKCYIIVFIIIINKSVFI
jgi:hypothetical protein